MAVIEVRGVTKRYGSVTALRDLDLTVEKGEVYGFLGPNGAGKSTTIDVLLDFVRPTDGRARVLGMDAREQGEAIRRRTGVLPDGYRVYDRLTGRRHVEFVAESKEVDADPAALLDRVGIADAADRPAGDYSKGMSQRLVLAMALVGEPDLLVLDEPTTGLDPNGARQMRELVREENERGATVFFSSHILAQVEAVCDRVGILQGGELVAEDSVEGLRDRFETDASMTVELSAPPSEPDRLREAVDGVSGVSSVRVEAASVVVACRDDAKMAVLHAVERFGEIADIETAEASLEELFAEVTAGEEPAADAGADAGTDEGAAAAGGESP
jgi:ABC-2 type transport system ATP-binding protein